MSSNLVSQKNYNTPALASEEIGIPESLSTKIQPKLTELHTQYVNIPTTSGAGPFSDGQQFSVQLPQNGYLQAGSLVLNFKSQFNYTEANTYAFGGPSASCGQLFNRISASAGSLMIDDVQNYFAYHSLLLESVATQSYSENTANILEGCYNDGTLESNGGASAGIVYATTTVSGTPYTALTKGTIYNYSMNVCLPVLSSGKNFPLWLLTSPLTLTFYLNMSGNAFTVPTPITNASFNVISPSITYHQVTLPKELELNIKDTMRATGQLYELGVGGVATYLNAVPQNASLSYNLSTNLASLNAVAYVAIQNLGVQTANKYFFKPEEQNTSVNSRLYCNNNQVNNYQINSDDMRIAEWMRALSGVFNFNTVYRYQYTTAVGRPAWNSNAFEGSTAQVRGYINGFSLRKNSEDNLSFTGTETQTLTLNLDRSVSAPATYFIFLFYDRIISLDADGRISVNQ